MLSDGRRRWQVCSHWSPQLTWRAFICCVVVSTFHNFLISQSDGLLHEPGAFVFGLLASDEALKEHYDFSISSRSFLWLV